MPSGPTKYVSVFRKKTSNTIVWCLYWTKVTVMFFLLIFFYLRPVSGIVVACICLCVFVSSRPCINHSLVRVITRDLFKLGSPNLDQRCKRPWLRSLFFLFVFFFLGGGAIYLDLQGQILLKSQNLPHFELVRTITHYPFKLGSQNWDKMCKIACFRSLLFWVAIDLDLKSQIFWSHHYWKYITTI